MPFLLSDEEWGISHDVKIMPESVSKEFLQAYLEHYAAPCK